AEATDPQGNGSPVFGILDYYEDHYDDDSLFNSIFERGSATIAANQTDVAGYDVDWGIWGRDSLGLGMAGLDEEHFVHDVEESHDLVWAVVNGTDQDIGNPSG